ncbi:IPT/TIG domain-containing protein [Xanthocytophaga agilis]|uniref:IPT/TIG domain-containing protein n=1 Tax=Xanthocytophaga agilis TaxID=3048010 RepID=A0AAE3R1D6_9BACT|nr:IPT/TIG domain-containing protein [Xanthocytophaga agilis]MDJ1502001.1 IPT/TIG domain-containing protein [Xanthocytophaga agilis]
MIFNYSKTRFDLLRFGIAMGLAAFAMTGCKDDEAPAIQVTSFSPASAFVGDTITITGNNFNTNIEKNVIAFGNRAAEIVSISATEMKVIVPKEAFSSKISLNMDGKATTTATDFTLMKMYFAGYDNNASKYWISSPITTASTALSNGTIRDYSAAMSVSDGNVYIAGRQSYNGVLVAKYWKNGTAKNLSDSVYNTYATSVVASNGNVYVAGYGYEAGKSALVAKYWKNDTTVVKLTNGDYHNYTTGIASVNGDVYVAGYGYEAGKDEYVAKYWKNGQQMNLTDGSMEARTTGIFVVNGDVYVTGYVYNASGNEIATFWKNGVEAPLSTVSSAATALAVVGSDVYVAGYEYKNSIPVATYWKNGTAQNLEHGTSGSYAKGIYVLNNHVYVLGHDYNAGDLGVVRYWKDGKAVDLTDGKTSATVAYGIVAP